IGLNWRMLPGSIRAAARSIDINHIVVSSEFADIAIDCAPEGSTYSIHNEQAFPAPGWHPSNVLEPKANDEAIVYCTPASTGTPKAVPLIHEAIESTLSAREYHDFNEGSRSLEIPPTFHAAGATWINYGLLTGVTQYFSDDTSPS